MPNNFKKTSLTGGAATDLDGISVAALADGDIAIVMDASDNVFHFEFESAATDAEDVAAHPYKVRPYDYATAGVWIEQEHDIDTSAPLITTIKWDQNVELLAANKTLVVADLPVQKLDPGGSDRDVTLPAEGDSTDIVFVIFNTADGAGEDLTIKNDGAATIGILCPGQAGMFSCDGTYWVGGLLWRPNVVLDRATGNEVAFPLAYTTNKVAGDDTGLQIDWTDTASPGTSKLIRIARNGSDYLEIVSDGTTPGSGAVQLIPCNHGGGGALKFAGQGGNIKAYVDFRSGQVNLVGGPDYYYGAMFDRIATATGPTLLPSGADSDTGIGHKDLDVLSLIAGGVNGMNLAEAGGIITVDVNGSIIEKRYQGGDDFDQEAAAVQLDAGINADFWTPGGTNYAAANLTYVAGAGGNLQAVTAGGDDDSVTILGLALLEIDKNPWVEARFKIADVTNAFIAVGLAEGSFADKAAPDDDIACVGIDTDNGHGYGAAQLCLFTNDNNAGLVTDDMGSAMVNDTFVKIRIDLTDTEQPRVWVNDTEIAAGSIAGTVQAGITVMPYIMVQSLSGTPDTFTIDYIRWGQDR